MYWHRTVPTVFLAALLLAAGGTLSGCGSSSSDTSPPSDLTYSTNPASYTTGVAITPNTPSSSGGPVASYSVLPALPTGLSLNATTGVISGTPAAATTRATYSVTATNAGGSTSAALDLTVIDPPSVLFFDDFESYALGTFPSTGGWSLYYSGAGSTYQYVDNAHAVSGTQSFHMTGGNSCWSATAIRGVTFPQTYSYEVDVYIDQIVSCGCSQFQAEVGPNTMFRLAFLCDGKLYAFLRYNPGSLAYLMPYTARTWYHVKVEANASTGLFSVYVDGALVASGLQSLDTAAPTSFLLAAEHGANPTAWFDNVKVTTP